MEITEQRLSEFGGWQAMKSAREMMKLGQVADAKRDEHGFHGLVGSGKMRYKASLLVNSRGQVEGRCSCADARRGLICPHELAVALQVLRKNEDIVTQRVQALTAPPPRQLATQSSGRSAEAIKAPQGRFYVHIMTSQLDRLEAGGTVPVFFRYESGEGTVMQELWEWLIANGMGKGSFGVRLDSAMLASLLKILRNYEFTLNGDKNAKTTDKILWLNDLLSFIKINPGNNQEYIVIQLDNDCLMYIKSLKAWFVQQPEGWGVMLLDQVSVDLMSGLLSGRVTLSMVEVVRRLDELEVLLGDVETWLPNLRIIPVTPIFTLELDGGLRRVFGALKVSTATGNYELFNSSVNDIYPVKDECDQWLYYIRNDEVEKKAWQRLLRAGMKETVGGALEVNGEAEVMRFLSAELPRLRKSFEIVEGPQWQSLTRSIAVIRPQVKTTGIQDETQQAGTGMDWLNLEVAYESVDGVSVSRNEVLRLIRSGQRQGRTAGGKRFVLDVEGCEDLEETLHDLTARLESGGRHLSIQRRQMGVLTDFAEKDMPSMESIPPLSDDVLQQQLGGLGGRLRDYQREGVRWMERLGRMGAGGLLADEMGLGKTVQTLALIKLLSGVVDNSGKRLPALVICPTSLLGNWADEARQFVPELRVHISHESARHEHLERLTDYDVIFTSYQLVARDMEALGKIMFAVVVLDEASYIRNADTVTSKAVRQLRSRACFALTGTPVENSVKDLWSIFEFALPGYLPARESFHERYVKKLTQLDSTQARATMERLRRLIRPYLLRRTKREVVKELPAKMERVVWCEMMPLQRELYTRLLEEGREEIRQARRKSGQGSARMTMFTVLLRLRQICNDIRLTGMKGDMDASGGKWPLFDEMVNELIEGDHRALVFSQFVGMLKLVRERLDKAEIPYCYLDGSTRDRAAQVEAFQAGGDRRFFLISLKAGGYGLNLTAADHVLLMDPWWNPAVEAQAIDRAHRIGQGRPVTAERFVTRGTVEEKILNLQAKKRAVMDMAMEEDAAVLSGLTDEELEEMIS